MNKKIKKMIILITTILIISILVIIVYCTLNYEKLKAKRQLNYINNSSKWDATIVYPEGAPVLKRTYEGEMTIKDIGKSIHYFTLEVIPKYYENLKNATDEEIKLYFEENKDIILMEIGSDDFKTFKGIIDLLKTLKGEELEFLSYRLDKETVRKNNSSTTANLYITYKENDELGFKIEVKDSLERNKSSVEYSIK